MKMLVIYLFNQHLPYAERYGAQEVKISEKYQTNKKNKERIFPSVYKPYSQNLKRFRQV